jgi:hypothetical protein
MSTRRTETSIIRADDLMSKTTCSILVPPRGNVRQTGVLEKVKMAFLQSFPAIHQGMIHLENVLIGSTDPERYLCDSSGSCDTTERYRGAQFTYPGYTEWRCCRASEAPNGAGSSRLFQNEARSGPSIQSFSHLH